MLGIMLPNLCLRRESPPKWAFLLRIAMTTWLALDWTKCQGDTLSVLLCSDTEHNPDFWFCQGGTGGKRRISLAMFQIFYNVLCNVPRKSLIIMLLKKFSWTKAAPYKEERYFRGVSDSIGNNYSPNAMNLSLKTFNSAKRSFSHGILYLKNMKWIG